MEGITIAETAIGIVGALKSTADAIKLFYTRAKSAGETLQDTYIAFQTCHTTLDLWIRFWGLYKGVSRRYQETLWGLDGMLTINLQLAKIQSKMTEVREELLPMMTQEGIVPDNPAGFDWLTTGDFRQSATKARRMLKIRDLFWFARGNGEDLSALVVGLGRSISEFRELSNTWFSLIHGPSLLQKPPEELANSIKFETFLRAVVDARSAAEMYFNALFGLVRGTLPRKLGLEYPRRAHLDLYVVKEEFRQIDKLQTFENIPLRYHMSVVGDEQTPRWEVFQVLADGPHKFEVIANSKDSSPAKCKPPGIWDAYDAARQSTTIHFEVPHSLNTTMVAWFRTRPPQSQERIFHPLSSVEGVEQRLRDFLHPLPTGYLLDKQYPARTQQLDFTFSQRLALVHTLALFILVRVPSGPSYFRGHSFFPSEAFLGSDDYKENSHHDFSGLSRVGDLLDQPSFSILVIGHLLLHSLTLLRPPYYIASEDHPFILAIYTGTDSSSSSTVVSTVKHFRSLGFILIEIGIEMPLYRVNTNSLGVAVEFVFVDNREQQNWTPGTDQGWLPVLVFALAQILSWIGLDHLINMFASSQASLNQQLEAKHTLRIPTVPAVMSVREKSREDSFNSLQELGRNTTTEVLGQYWAEVQTRMDLIAGYVNKAGSSMPLAGEPASPGPSTEAARVATL
ncbi:hypothetical protein QBC38DRAFT_523935 [Podospora fimiseda]|uniref:Uncharacterized protein n=1 Tax=Podospora fimiseda TaxID=252190 RepID=A0AAN6YNH5_9PEZI|nr:hypothetical protein QBC38DRAFT_523935 [Podospora fimiseda]